MTTNENNINNNKTEKDVFSSCHERRTKKKILLKSFPKQVLF